MNTPFIVRWPGVVPAGRADLETALAGVDVFPTVLAATGVAAKFGSRAARTYGAVAGGNRRVVRDLEEIWYQGKIALDMGSAVIADGNTWTPPVLTPCGVLIKDKRTLSLWEFEERSALAGE